MQYKLIALNITPNQITLLACALCISYSALLAWSTSTSIWLLLLPLVLLLRMMLNALDGMVANATNNRSPLGMVLNELCDVVSDLALLSAFLVILPTPLFWWLLIALSMLTEFTSLSVQQATGIRSHSGPFGKSDRAVYLGILALSLLIFQDSMLWLNLYILLGVALSIITIFNRFQPLFTTTDV